MSIFPPPDPIAPESVAELEFRRLQIIGEITIKRMDTINVLALSGLKALTLLNGGAVVALFALVAQGAGSDFVAKVNRPLLLASFGLFAFGAALTVGATLLGYFGQQILHVYEQEMLRADYHRMRGRSGNYPNPEAVNSGNMWLRLAGWTAGAALAAFILGSGLALMAALGAARS